MQPRQYSPLGALMAAAMLIVTSMTDATAETTPPTIDDENAITLYYSDGTPPARGLQAVNRILMTVGVRVSQVTIPSQAKPILQASVHRAVTSAETQALIRHFHLGRRELVEEIRKAGRQPAMHRGGSLQTSERNVPPYPKVYDMQALDHDTTAFLQRKFGTLHVNSSEAGVGIDEVMTIVSGGPYTWFFVFENNVVGKLRFGKVHANGEAWRISYPGLVPHGGYFDAPHGLVVAHAHGPKHFIMRYEDESVQGDETLGDNPWIDFTQEPPVLLEQPKAEGAVSTTQSPRQ
ncbi:hypothetical protein Thiosp_02110 [Thiorhodovibrio litoralis]|nr:hypothetical protein Thiosp_01725 [Thiorhodovibrio litoralis]WPL12346.1 hypothetical protein Thiosp_02110 [Thiorhodovibrio litoralis]